MYRATGLMSYCSLSKISLPLPEKTAAMPGQVTLPILKKSKNLFLK